jgi:hypothetical protein
MRTQLNIDFSKLSDSQMAVIEDIFKEQHGETFNNMLERNHCFTLACGGSPYEEKQNPIYVTGSETFRLIPLGEIRFRWNKNSRMTKAEPIYIGEVDQSGERIRISEADEKRLYKIMKKHNTDLFTDGDDFYTTFGACIGKVDHPRFRKLLEENNEVIRELLYG